MHRIQRGRDERELGQRELGQRELGQRELGQRELGQREHAELDTRYLPRDARYRLVARDDNKPDHEGCRKEKRLEDLGFLVWEGHGRVYGPVS